jgi:glycosyltransferase involved in cell wall biosynthesis
VRLTALVDSPEHVCCRYRLAAFRPFFAAAGHQLELRPFPRTPWHWLALARVLRERDAVIVQRKLLSPWQLYAVRRACRFLIFDFDDAVFLRDSYSRKGLHSRRRKRRFSAIVRAAELVVAGNDFLREAALAWTTPERVAVIPTCVDVRGYPRAEHCRAGEGVELAWIGSASTLQGLEAIRPLLETLGQRVPGLRLKLICDKYLDLQHLPVIPCAWSEATEAAELAGADIGISWLPDDLWSRGKCGLKVLQYMAAGLPVVANPVGVQREMIRSGGNGFLAKTADEWVEAVGRLACDPGLRRALGSVGRQLVEREYSVECGANRWLRALDRLAARRRMTA